MDKQLPLFPAPEPPQKKAIRRETTVGPAKTTDEIAALGSLLPRHLYLGTSSWHFPGWKDIVWDRAAAESDLARNGLAAYARHPLLRSVSLDRTFYGPLPASGFAAYARQVPDGFRFVVKAPQAVTGAYLRNAGGKPAANPHFLDAVYATEHFIRPCLEGLGARTGPLLFQFPPAGRFVTRDPARFAARLHDFLSALPAVPAEAPDAAYVIELRDPELLTRALFATLRTHNARYCIGVHPRMPPVAAQAAAMAGSGQGPLVLRWNLHAGYRYEEAKSRYAPFDRLVDEDPSTRESIARLAAAALSAGHPAFVIANNKAEGSAPLTLVKLATAIRAALKAR
ncbi:MAG: DUF72 domain-containing protein [Burkholderiales bacterium]|nr:DUF72 domain-containing protein [Burkholderiales bacterium]